MIPILGGIAFVGFFAWMWHETQVAPDAQDALPASRICLWCGQPMSDTDRWLRDNGALVTHTICRACAATLEDE